MHIALWTFEFEIYIGPFANEEETKKIMSGNKARLQALTALAEPCKLEPKFDFIGDSAQELFGSNVFSLRVMKAVTLR